MRPFALAVLALSIFNGAVFAADQTWADLNLEVIDMYQKKEYAQAVPVAQQARDAAESEYGAESRESVLAMNNLAMLYKKTGHTTAAGPLYRNALKISEKLYGVDNPDLALPLNNLAMFYNEQDDFKKADEYSQRAISILEKEYGPKHALTLQARERHEAMKKAR